VQLRPGHWLLTLTARAIAPLEKVALKLPAAPWPRQEIWSYRDDPALRGSRAEGQGIDAAQAGVPDDWSDLPAFALNDGTGLTITAGARGDEGGKGDQIHLRREMWLDFDGGGLRTADHLSGELRHHQRLDVTAPWQLQRASEGGTPLLVSKGGDGRSGANCARANSISTPACACPCTVVRSPAPAGDCRWKASAPACTCRSAIA